MFNAFSDSVITNCYIGNQWKNLAKNLDRAFAYCWKVRVVCTWVCTNTFILPLVIARVFSIQCPTILYITNIDRYV